MGKDFRSLVLIIYGAKERKEAWQCVSCNLVYHNYDIKALRDAHRCPAEIAARVSGTNFKGGKVGKGDSHE